MHDQVLKQKAEMYSERIDGVLRGTIESILRELEQSIVLENVCWSDQQRQDALGLCKQMMLKRLEQEIRSDPMLRNPLA